MQKKLLTSAGIFLVLGVAIAVTASTTSWLFLLGITSKISDIITIVCIVIGGIFFLFSVFVEPEKNKKSVSSYPQAK